MSNPYDEVVGKAEKEVGGGKYLSLKEKGQKIVIRIASDPMYTNKHWLTGADGKNVAVVCTGEDCVYCGTKVAPTDRVKKTPLFAWIVLDRNDNNKPKIFKGGLSIAKDLKDLSNDSEWGDPTKYDVSITRTEEPGKGYYKTVPTRNSDPITEDEQKAIAEAGFDLKSELEDAKEAKSTGGYGGKKAEELETPETKSESVETDGDDEEIPF